MNKIYRAQQQTIALLVFVSFVINAVAQHNPRQRQSMSVIFTGKINEIIIESE